MHVRGLRILTNKIDFMAPCSEKDTHLHFKTHSGHRTEKVQFSFQSQRKAMPKNAQTTSQLPSSHMLVNDAQKSPSQASGEP